MKRALLCTAVLLALSACGQQSGSETGAPERVVSKPAAGPEIGTFGVAVSDMDASVAPGDDFFRHVNGRWLDSFRIPDEFANYGSFTVLAERTETQLRKIIDELAAANAAAGTERRQIADFFAAFSDQAAIDAKGFGAAAADLAFIDGLATHEDVARAMARPELGASGPVAMLIAIDAKRPERYTVTLTHSGLGLPNRDYYLEERFSAKREKYRAYLAEALAIAGIADAASKAEAIYEVERRIAEAHWEPAKRRNRDLTYNLKTRDQLRTFAPEMPFDAMFEVAGVGGESEVILREDDAIAAIARIFRETPVETWRAYLTMRLLDSRASVLPSALDRANFAFYGTEITGAPKQRERWKRAIASINQSMGHALAKIYVERHFPAQSKAQMDALVANLGRALEERIAELDWMSEKTKGEARAKLARFESKIGYPSKWRDFAGLEIVADDAYGNAKRAAGFNWAWQTSRLGKPVDKSEWSMLPQTVNASYNPQRNDITFPAAILQPPFFDPLADPAVNYGAIGAVIGHEIGHGFDDQGRKSDGDGVLRDWWTAADAANFEKLTAKLGAQYATYEPYPGFPVNPALTMGENVGDVGGLAMAYRAYRLSLGGAEAPIIDGFTGDQRFFMAWAQVWKSLYREDALKNRIATDPHSPPQYRVNGVVRNMDAWYDAFAVEPDAALYLAPGDRVQIW